MENPSLQNEAMAWLQQQRWQGNVRELENVVRQALLLARPFPIGLEHVKLALAKSRKPSKLAGEGHRAYIAHLLNRAQRDELEGAYASGAFSGCEML